MGINKNLKIAIIAVLLPLGILVPVLSIRSYHTAITDAQESNSSLESRKKEYKKSVTEDNFSESEKERIKTRCLAVKTNIKTLDARLAKVKERREKVYDKILKRLNELTENLKVQNIDTEELDSGIGTLNSKITTYKATMQQYKQAVNDMTMIDCKEDPESFKGALEAARTKHAELITQVSDIREYVENTIKSTLDVIRQEISQSQRGSN